MRYNDLPMLDGAKGLSGHLDELNRDRLSVLNRVAKSEAPLLRLQIPLSARAVMVNGPEVLNEILVEQAKSFEKAFMTRNALAPLGGEGLFTSDGELWRTQRRLMAPLFQHNQIAGYAADMVRCTDLAIDTWKEGSELRLLDETTRITMAVAGKTLFDANTFSEADEIGHALTTALTWVGNEVATTRGVLSAVSYAVLRNLSAHFKTPLSSTLRERAESFVYPRNLHTPEDRTMLAAIEMLDLYVADMVAERRKHPGAKSDLLSRLLGAHDDEHQTRMTDKQLRDEVLTLFVAGHETTATGLAWTLYYLTRAPALYAQARAEVDALGSHVPSLEDLPKLGFLLRAFKESLRIAPPVYISSRQVWQGGAHVGQVDLRPGTACVFSPYALHHRASIWPEPQTFDPDRFLPENESKRHKLAWLPFSAGPRVCIGNHFSLMEAQLVLARILQRFDLSTAADEEPEAHATLRPKHGVRVRITPRPHGSVAA